MHQIEKKCEVSGDQCQMEPNMFPTALESRVALYSSVLSAQHDTPDSQPGTQSSRRLGDLARVTQLVPHQSQPNLYIYLFNPCLWKFSNTFKIRRV